MIKPETATYDFQTLDSVDSQMDSSVFMLPLFLLGKLASIAVSIGWIILGTVVTVYGFVDMFARMAILSVGLYKLLRRPPSAGRILLGATMIFAGSMDLFMKSVLCTSYCREVLAKISSLGIYGYLYRWFSTTANPPVAEIVKKYDDGVDCSKKDVIDLIRINPAIVCRYVGRTTTQEPKRWPEFCDIDMKPGLYPGSYNPIHLQYIQEFE